MDIDYNAITGVDYSQLTPAEKTTMLECLNRLLPFGWTDAVLRTWFVNRKIAITRDAGVTKYYGLVPVHQWRLLLETENNKPTWHVDTYQWLPLEGEQR